jgi:tetratricopeptide (TPR) repeat protein
VDVRSTRGLPPRTYLPFLLIGLAIFLGVVVYFLRIGLGVTGSALGPSGPIAQQGDARQQAVAPANAAPTLPAGEEAIPQSGTAGGAAQGDAAVQAPAQQAGGAAIAAGGPPPAIMRIVAEAKARIARNPNDLSALISLASLYFDANKFDQAIPYYERALAIDPTNPDSRTDYATALHTVGRDLDALKQIDIVLNAQPNFAPALFNEGIVASAIGRRTQAVGAFERFLKVSPHDGHADDARTALHNLGA